MVVAAIAALWGLFAVQAWQTPTLPLAQLVLLWAAFVVSLGRRPGLGRRDLALALVLQTLIWLASPLPGVLYFYRPFATNYLFTFAATLCLLAPYRLALARPEPLPAGGRWAPAMFALALVLRR